MISEMVLSVVLVLCLAEAVQGMSAPGQTQSAVIKIDDQAVLAKQANKVLQELLSTNRKFAQNNGGLAKLSLDLHRVLTEHLSLSDLRSLSQTCMGEYRRSPLVCDDTISQALVYRKLVPFVNGPRRMGESSRLLVDKAQKLLDRKDLEAIDKVRLIASLKGRNYITQEHVGNFVQRVIADQVTKKEFEKLAHVIVFLESRGLTSRGDLALKCVTSQNLLECITPGTFNHGYLYLAANFFFDRNPHIGRKLIEYNPEWSVPTPEFIQGMARVTLDQGIGDFSDHCMSSTPPLVIEPLKELFARNAIKNLEDISLVDENSKTSDSKIGLKDLAQRGCSLDLYCVQHAIVKNGKQEVCYGCVGILHACVHSRNMKGIAECLSLDVDSNFRSLFGRLPLSIACKNYDKDAAFVLLQAGADVDRVLVDGNTCLEDLIVNEPTIDSNAWKEVVMILIRHGARLNQLFLIDSVNYTILHRMVERGHKDIIELMLDYAVNINDSRVVGINSQGNEIRATPLDEATNKWPQIAKLLKERGGKTYREMQDEGKKSSQVEVV